MPDFNVNLEGQIASELTRNDLLTLIGSSTVKKKHYHITDAVNGSRKVAVFYRTNNSTTFWAYDVMTGQRGKYFIVQDLFFPLAEPQGAVLTYVNLAAFPLTGAFNTVYIAQDTGNGYTWDGANYDLLSGGTVFAANFAALPLTGAANTLYITTDNGNSYLWDGTQYVLTSNGQPTGLVESVTGDSVDNTDPENPVVNAIPLSGTASGSPMIGDIQASKAQYSIYQGVLGSVSNGLDSRGTFLGNTIQLFRNAGSGNVTTMGIDSSGNAHVTSSHSGFQGIKYVADYSANFILETLISQRVLKSRFWTKAGAPTTSDDSTQGFIVGSLIFDTTNSILYRCTNNSTGAAVWTTNFQQLRNDAYVNLGGGTIPAGTTQYAPIGSQAAFNSDETTRYTPQPEDAVVFKFKVYIRTAQPGTGSAVVNLRANGSNISTITIPAGSAAGVYGSNTVAAIAENDLLTIGVTNNASGASAQFTSATLAMYN